MVADGHDEVLVRSREQLMQGASQIKLTAGGGVASPFSPLDVSTFTADGARRGGRSRKQLGHLRRGARLHAASHPARDRGRGEMHRARAFDGRRHRATHGREGHLAEPAAFLDDEDAIPLPPGSPQRAKQARSSPARTTSTRSQKNTRSRPPSEPICFSRRRWRTGKAPNSPRWCGGTRLLKPWRWRRRRTRELLQLSGPRNPYPGTLGLVQEGALADLLLVEGNPLENIDLVADPAKNFKIIMKDGKIYKNTLAN